MDARAAIKSSRRGYEESRDDDDDHADDDGLSASAKACLAQIDLNDDNAPRTNGPAARLIRASRDAAFERELRARAPHERWNTMNKAAKATAAANATTTCGAHACDGVRCAINHVAIACATSGSSATRLGGRFRDDERLLPVAVWAQPDRILGGRVGQPGDTRVSRRHATRAREPKVRHQGKAMVPQRASSNMFSLMAQCD